LRQNLAQVLVHRLPQPSPSSSQVARSLRIEVNISGAAEIERAVAAFARALMGA
jgi:hypothetical protein